MERAPNLLDLLRSWVTDANTSPSCRAACAYVMYAHEASEGPNPVADDYLRTHALATWRTSYPLDGQVIAGAIDFCLVPDEAREIWTTREDTPDALRAIIDAFPAGLESALLSHAASDLSCAMDWDRFDSYQFTDDIYGIRDAFAWVGESLYDRLADVEYAIEDTGASVRGGFLQAYADRLGSIRQELYTEVSAHLEDLRALGLERLGGSV